MKPKKTEVITPAPFFKISFGCSNIAFYAVKNELYEIAAKVGIEIEDGFITQKCDYDGDLEEILIYNNDRAEHLIQSVLAFYGVPIIDLPEGMDVALTIF
jgi:hypothetical protein